MTGKYELEIYNRRVHYHLTISRNITIIQGNSATGKTELIRMISDYENNGNSSGITEICEKSCITLENSTWREKLKNHSGCIAFADEGSDFLTTQEFAEAVKNSDHYFVLVTREDLVQLPYSIKEIYGMRLDREKQKYNIPKKIYNELYQLYGVENEKENQMKDFSIDTIITEDSNSGFDFFQDVWKNKCISAKGKSNILTCIRKCETESILAVVNGAAFGPEMQKVMRYIRDSSKRIWLYAPESFEYLLLKADILPYTSKVTEKTYNYADSRKYFSWEEFYTDYLVKISVGTIYQYSKKKLKEEYLTAGNKKKILEQLPVRLKEQI